MYSYHYHYFGRPSISLNKKKHVQKTSKKRRSRTPSCTGIHDPYTGKCLKMSMHGTLYNRYIIPFMLGDTSFLSLFSLKDQEKILMFLQKKHLLPVHGGHEYQYVCGPRGTSMSERRKSKSINVDELIRQVAINYFYKDGIFDTDIQPDELQEKIDELRTFYNQDFELFRAIDEEYKEQTQKILDPYISRTTDAYFTSIRRNPAFVDDEEYEMKKREFAGLNPIELETLENKFISQSQQPI